MQWSGWINFGITVGLFLAFVVAVAYYYSPNRKTKVEEPKYKMLDDDDQETTPKGSAQDDRKK